MSIEEYFKGLLVESHKMNAELDAEITRLRAEVETITRKFEEAHAMAIALKHKVEELKKNQLKPGEVRARYEPCRTCGSNDPRKPGLYNTMGKDGVICGTHGATHGTYHSCNLVEVKE